MCGPVFKGPATQVKSCVLRSTRILRMPSFHPPQSPAPEVPCERAPGLSNPEVRRGKCSFPLVSGAVCQLPVGSHWLARRKGLGSLRTLAGNT